jgi:hypothetical protein
VKMPQLGSNLSLNKLSNELFSPKTELSIKRYDGFFQNFASRCVIIFVIVCRNWLKFGILANWYTIHLI